MKKPKIPNSQKTSGDYLRNSNVIESKKIVEEAKNLPHLQKPIKYLLKN